VTYYTLDSVLMAFALTCIVTCALTAYAMKTDKDFSVWGAGYVFFIHQTTTTFYSAHSWASAEYWIHFMACFGVFTCLAITPK